MRTEDDDDGDRVCRHEICKNPSGEPQRTIFKRTSERNRHERKVPHYCKPSKCDIKTKCDHQALKKCACPHMFCSFSYDKPKSLNAHFAKYTHQCPPNCKGCVKLEKDKEEKENLSKKLKTSESVKPPTKIIKPTEPKTKKGSFKIKKESLKFESESGSESGSDSDSDSESESDKKRKLVKISTKPIKPVSKLMPKKL